MTDAHVRAVVAGIRGLGQASVPVTALAPRRSAAGLWSRYATDREIVADPGTAPERFVEGLAAIARRRPGAVIYPGTERSIAAVLSGWDRLTEAGAKLPYPGPEPLAAVRDKRRLRRLAAAAGLATPRSERVVSAARLRKDPPPYPFVVKPALPPGSIESSHPIGSPGALERLLARRRVPADEPLVVQDLCRGALVSLELVVGADGEVVARFQQRADRTWPPDAGSIASAEATPVDPGLIGRAARLLEAAGYWGLAQFDFLLEEGEPVLIDVNPRFYSCLPLALACGVNLPAAWHRVATGVPATGPAGSDSAGARYRWLEGDVRRAIKQRSLRWLLGPGRADAGAMWAGDDPLPGLMLGVGSLTAPIRARIGGSAR